ncbi:hypothetical protein BB558_004139 [Smittium angustum]|uniref:CRIM domain-containing protein n=1 Tax=Smittium angustum TaxID=133377 RepID=A0A2U1J411_SMIAN|nr:hypothetical protein BB558_004139 [Smittium angustum]
MSTLFDEQFLIHQFRKNFLQNKDGVCENVISSSQVDLLEEKHTNPYIHIFYKEMDSTQEKSNDKLEKGNDFDLSPGYANDIFGLGNQFKKLEMDSSINFNFHPIQKDFGNDNGIGNGFGISHPKDKYIAKPPNYTTLREPTSVKPNTDVHKKDIKLDMEIKNYFEKLNFQSEKASEKSSEEFSKPSKVSDNNKFKPKTNLIIQTQESIRKLSFDKKLPVTPSKSGTEKILSKINSINKKKSLNNPQKIKLDQDIENEYVEIILHKTKEPSKKNYKQLKLNQNQQTNFSSVADSNNLSPLPESNANTQKDNMSQYQTIDSKSKRSTSVFSYSQGIPLLHLNSTRNDNSANKGNYLLELKNHSHGKLIAKTPKENEFHEDGAQSTTKTKRSLTFPSILNSENNLEIDFVDASQNGNETAENKSESHQLYLDDVIELRNPKKREFSIDNSIQNQRYFDLMKTSEEIPLKFDDKQNKMKFRARPKKPPINSRSSFEPHKRPMSMRFDFPKKGTMAAIRPISILFSSGESDDELGIDNENSFDYEYQNDYKFSENNVHDINDVNRESRPFSLGINIENEKTKSLEKNTLSRMGNDEFLNRKSLTSKHVSAELSKSVDSTSTGINLEPLDFLDEHYQYSPTIKNISNRDSQTNSEFSSGNKKMNRRSSVPVGHKSEGTKPSGLALMLMDFELRRSSNPFESEYSKYQGVGNMILKLQIFLPQQLVIKTPKISFYSMEVSLGRSTTTEQAIGFTLYQYLDQSNKESLLPKNLMSVEYWCMRIAEPDGEIDYDFPVLDRNQKISQFGSLDFALCQATPEQIAATTKANNLTENKNIEAWPFDNLQKETEFELTGISNAFDSNQNNVYNLDSSKQKATVSDTINNMGSTVTTFLKKTSDGVNADTQSGLPSARSDFQNTNINNPLNQVNGLTRLLKIFLWQDKFGFAISGFSGGFSSSDGSEPVLHSTTVNVPLLYSIHDVLLLVCRKYGFNEKQFSLVNTKNPTMYIDQSTIVNNLAPDDEMYLLPSNIFSKADTKIPKNMFGLTNSNSTSMTNVSSAGTMGNSLLTTNINSGNKGMGIGGSSMAPNSVAPMSGAGSNIGGASPGLTLFQTSSSGAVHGGNHSYNYGMNMQSMMLSGTILGRMPSTAVSAMPGSASGMQGSAMINGGRYERFTSNRSFTVLRKVQLFTKVEMTLVIEGEFMALIPQDNEFGASEEEL